MRKKPKIKSHGIFWDVIKKFRDLQVTKIPVSFIPGYFRNENLGIFGPGIFKSRDYPWISQDRDIPCKPLQPTRPKIRKCYNALE